MIGEEEEMCLDIWIARDPGTKRAEERIKRTGNLSSAVKSRKTLSLVLLLG